MTQKVAVRLRGQREAGERPIESVTILVRPPADELDWAERLDVPLDVAPSFVHVAEYVDTEIYADNSRPSWWRRVLTHIVEKVRGLRGFVGRALRRRQSPVERAKRWVEQAEAALGITLPADLIEAAQVRAAILELEGQAAERSDEERAALRVQFLVRRWPELELQADSLAEAVLAAPLEVAAWAERELWWPELAWLDAATDNVRRKQREEGNG